MSDNKFDYTYSAPTEAERREIESIKKQYLGAPEKKDKLERLRALNTRVTRPPLIVGIIIAIVGTLVMGLGMAMVMEWDIKVWGAVVGVAGVAIAAVGYPIYRAILNANKRRYGQQIIELSNELLNERNDNK